VLKHAVISKDHCRQIRDMIADKNYVLGKMKTNAKCMNDIKYRASVCVCVCDAGNT